MRMAAIHLFLVFMVFIRIMFMVSVAAMTGVHWYAASGQGEEDHQCQ